MVFDVIEVEEEHFFKGEFRSAGYLPQAGDTGFDAAPLLVPIDSHAHVFHLFKVFNREGSWADDGHFAFEDIEELGEFIQAEFADNASEPGYAGVFFDFE